MKKVLLSAILAAILTSFSPMKKDHEMMILGCSASREERNMRLNQIVAYMSFGPMSLIGYETGDQPGMYCYRIYFFGN